MAATNSPIILKILGQRLVLKSDADSDRSRRVVEWVTERVSVIEKRLVATSKSSVIPPMHIALLALLEIGQEYLDAKGRTEKYQTEMNQVAQMLMQELKNQELNAQKNASQKPGIDARHSDTSLAAPGLTIERMKPQRATKKRPRHLKEPSL